LAQQQFPTSKLLDMGPGRVIEFDRQYDQPLVVSVNNLPIAVGEAVKIGDHFGLKISRIVSVEQRIEELGGKWRF
jgi:flagellar motor switch protein FliN/FliY